MRVLVVGGAGQLGRALRERLGDDVVWAGGRAEVDVRDAAAVSAVVAAARPDLVVNASAYNKVDQAETEPAEAFAVNALGPQALARAAHAVGALLVQVSTDYVFDGSLTRPYTEEDCPGPRNVYGISKRAGEMLVMASPGPYLVVRTSGLFGSGGSRDKGGSFLDRILARARAGQELRVVDDQVFAPTWAPDLAESIVALVERGARGLFHVTNSGSCSWFELARHALATAGLAAPIVPISTRDLGAPARRPAYSVLATDRYSSLGLPRLRPWREAVEAQLAR